MNATTSSTEMPVMRLFVYGTLKRGGSNHGCMTGQRFIGMALTEPRYRLFDLGGYPGMVLNETAGLAIEGEVWEVDEAGLRRLDELEDVEGGEYARERIALQPPFDGQDVQGYLYLRPVASFRDCGSRWG